MPTINCPRPYASPPHTAMVELDGDDVRISSRGKLAERDIVQVKLIVQAAPLARLTSHFLLGVGGLWKGPWREPLGAPK